MVHVPWVDLKTDTTFHKQGAKTPLTPNPLRTLYSQVTETLHHLKKNTSKLGLFLPQN